MSRKLIVANTYYQIIFAIQMKLTAFKDDKIDILISDHSKNADIVTQRLKKCGPFENADYMTTKGPGDNRNFSERVRDFFCLTFGKRNSHWPFKEDSSKKFYDELIVYNYDMQVLGFYYNLSSINPEIKFSRFEEGILSYNNELLFTPTRNLIGKLRRMQGKNTIEDAMNFFYCGHPELYRGELEPYKIPLIKKDDNALKNILQEIFNFDPQKNVYTQRYIFFTSVLDFEGGEPIGEYELVSKVAELVGKDNLLVKTHPRDKRTIYIDNGFNVDKNSAIPWEVIQLSGDFSDKVFLTVNSGSVLAGSFMSEKPVRTFYMYKLCNISNNPCCQKNAADVEALLNNQDMKDILSEVSIADRIEDIIVG